MNNNDTESSELSSHEETRFEFNRSTGAIKLGIDVHQDYYVVVKQEGGANPKPAQRFRKEAFVHWAAKLKSQGGEISAVRRFVDYKNSKKVRISQRDIPYQKKPQDSGNPCSFYW